MTAASIASESGQIGIVKLYFFLFFSSSTEFFVNDTRDTETPGNMKFGGHVAPLDFYGKISFGPRGPLPPCAGPPQTQKMQFFLNNYLNRGTEDEDIFMVCWS